MKQKKEYSVKIIWGSDPDVAEIATYRFDSQKEFEIFLEGVEAAIGWHDCEIGDEHWVSPTCGVCERNN